MVGYWRYGRPLCATSPRCGGSALDAWPALGVKCLLRDRTDPAHALIHIAVDRHRRVRSPTGVRDAVLDVVSRACSDFAAVAVLAEACRTRRTTPQRLVATLAERVRSRRRTWLNAVLATCPVLEECGGSDVSSTTDPPHSGYSARTGASRASLRASTVTSPR